METAHTRTTASQMEAVIMNGISKKGQEGAAKHVGVDRCQISRWISGKDSMLSKFCRLLEFVDFDKPDGVLAIAGHEAREIATTLRMMRLMLNPSKAKSPPARTDGDSELQITIDF